MILGEAKRRPRASEARRREASETRKGRKRPQERRKGAVWWGSPTHNENGASRGVLRAYNQRYTDDQRPTGGTSETAGRGFRHVHRRRTRTFGGCPGWLDRECGGCLSVGRAGVGTGRNPAPPLELVSLPLIATAVSPPRVEGAGGLAGRRTYPRVVHDAGRIVLKKYDGSSVSVADTSCTSG